MQCAVQYVALSGQSIHIPSAHAAAFRSLRGLREYVANRRHLWRAIGARGFQPGVLSRLRALDGTAASIRADSPNQVQRPADRPAASASVPRHGYRQTHSLPPSSAHLRNLNQCANLMARSQRPVAQGSAELSPERGTAYLKTRHIRENSSRLE